MTCKEIFKLYPPSSPHQPQPVDAAPELAPLGAETNKDKGSERGSSCIHPHSTRSTPKPHYGGYPPYPWARGLPGRSRAASLHLLLLPGPFSAIRDSESPLGVATGHPLCPPLSPRRAQALLPSSSLRGFCLSARVTNPLISLKMGCVVNPSLSSSVQPNPVLLLLREDSPTPPLPPTPPLHQGWQSTTKSLCRTLTQEKRPPSPKLGSLTPPVSLS